MRRFLTFMLLFVLLLTNNTFAVPPDDQSVVQEVTLEASLKRFEDVSASMANSVDWKTSNSGELNVNSMALSVWNFHDIIQQGYYILLFSDVPDTTEIAAGSDAEKVLNKLKEAVAVINKTHGSCFTSDFQPESTTTVQADRIKQTLELSTDINVTTYGDLKKKLRSYLVSTIPNMYASILDYASALGESKLSSFRDSISFMKSGLEQIENMQTKLESTFGAGLAAEDKIDGVNANNALTSRAALFKTTEEKESNAINEAIANKGGDFEEFLLLQERSAFVSRVPEEELLASLGEDFDIEKITGVNLWRIKEGGEAPFAGQASVSPTFREGPGLRDEFLVLFASTAVYTPLHSKTGDEDYMQAAISLVPSERKAQLREYFAAMASYRKPLYFFTDKKTIKDATALGDSYEDYSGSSQRLLLRDLLECVQSKTKMVASTIKGKLVSDNDAWMYYNNELVEIDGVVGVNESTVEDGGTVPSNNQYSRAVLEINFKNGDPGPGTVTASLMNNIYEDEYLRNQWVARQSEPIYLDAFGNVILGDGTVVLPAAANPTYFAVPTLLPNSSMWWYNPFTVAFWNTYPVIYGSDTSPSIQARKDKNKWVVSYQDPTQVSAFGVGNTDINSISDPFDNIPALVSEDPYMQYKFVTFPISSRQANAKIGRLSSTFITGYLYPFFTTPIFETGRSFQSEVGIEVLSGNLSTGDKEDALKSSFNFYPLRLKPVFSGSHQVFPYESPTSMSNDSDEPPTAIDFTAAKIIAANMYLYITNSSQNVEGDVSVPSGNGVLREGYMFSVIVCSVLDGLMTPIAYEKSIAVANILLSDSLNFVEKFFLKFCAGVVNFGKKFSHFMGIATPDQDSILDPIYTFIMQYYLYIVFLILLLLLILYIKERSFQKVVISGGVFVLAVFGFLFVLPGAIPFFIGAPSSLISEKITADVLLVKGEKYDKIYSDDPYDQYELGSVKLYNLKLEEAYRMRAERNYYPKSFMTNRMDLDDQMGIYMKGNEIKLDLKKFWTLNVYKSEYVTDDDINSYQISRADYMSSPEIITYYTPWLVLEDGFVENLNLFLKDYGVPKSVIKYPDGLIKDTYVINSFIHSYPFLYVVPDIQQRLNEDAYISELAILQRDFPNPGDVLRLQWLVDTEFEDLEPEIANTVWVQTMYKNGYYDLEYGRERRRIMVDHVNQEVYAFLIKVTPDIGLVSDENMIRLTSLYATLAFNEQISRWGDIVYPRYVEASEFNVSDILTAVVLKNSVRFLFYDVDLVSNVYVEKGPFGLFVACLTILLMIIYSLINSALLPIVYLGSVAMVLFLTLAGKSVNGALAFALKSLLLLIGMSYLSLFVMLTYDLFSSSLNIYILCVLLGVVLWLSKKCFVWIFKSTSWFSESPVNNSLSRIRAKAAHITGGNYYRSQGYVNYGDNNAQYYRDDFGVNHYSQEDYEGDEHDEPTTESNGRRYYNY